MPARRKHAYYIANLYCHILLLLLLFFCNVWIGILCCWMCSVFIFVLGIPLFYGFQIFFFYPFSTLTQSFTRKFYRLCMCTRTKRTTKQQRRKRRRRSNKRDLKECRKKHLIIQTEFQAMNDFHAIFLPHIRLCRIFAEKNKYIYKRLQWPIGDVHR